MVTSVGRVGAIAIALVMCSCTPPTKDDGMPRAQPGTDFQEMRVVRNEVVSVRGRPFWLNVIEAPDPLTHAVSRSLSISGDDRLVGFGADAGEQDFRVSANDIAFGGHSFTVTATPGDYLLDGKPVTLKGLLSHRRRHSVVNGTYLGEDELP